MSLTQIEAVTMRLDRTATKWTDPFLDAMRQQGDPLADECFEALRKAGAIEQTTALFKTLDTHGASLPENIPPALRRFFDQTRTLPENTDQDRIKNGENVFLTHAFPSALVLLAKSLPSGYAAPNLSHILALSSNLEQHPYKRTLAVLQMMVNVSTCRGFTPGGEAVVTAQKLRLLHAGIRCIVRRHLPDYETRYGVPVNQEDMLGTIMGFSYLVISGFRTLGLGLSPEEEEDYFYLWRTYAQLMGIHPENLPEHLDDAAAFYHAYARRHYVSAAANPDGVKLATADLRMMQQMLPSRWCRYGLKIVPRIYMQQLIGQDGCRRVGIQPVMGYFILRWLLRQLPRLWMKPWVRIDERHRNLHETLSRLFFQGLINREYGGEVSFSVPETLADLKKLV
jgi:ER-bound oxygenase mpaB/B'/Rubber oxygenase, catalytic domain